MNWLLSPPLRPAVLLAAAASAIFNLMLIVPALYTLQVFERVFTSRSVETLLMLSLLVVVALALSYAMDVLRGRALALASRRLGELLMPMALERLLHRQAQRIPTGADPSRDVAALQRFITGKGALALFDAPWLPAHLLMISLMHPALGAAAAAGALLLMALGVLADRLTREAAGKLELDSRAAQQQRMGLMRRAEAIVGLGLAAPLLRRWHRSDEVLQQQQDRLTQRTLRLAAAARCLRQALQAAVLGFGAWLVIAQAASPGIMVAATLLLGRALQPAQQLIAGWKQLVQARSAWQRLAEPGPVGELPSAHELPAPQGELRIERLVHGGGNGRQPLLRGIELVLPAGSSLGLVGTSGSGKSSLARLLIGLWPAQAGVVRLDGADIAQWPRERLAPHIGWLPQDAELFAGTVAENIARLGDAEPEAVTAAAQRASAHEMILRLPQGYDTPVGEAGSALSGGQRQRVALARALFGAPRLVVLDEPEAHLDSDGEAALEAALRHLKAEGATVIVITHRRRLLTSLDRVVVLHDGLLQALPVEAPPLRAVARA